MAVGHQRSISWIVWLVVCLLPLPAIAPLIGPGLIATHRYGDSPFLLVRLVALVDALRQGVLFPRWSPELAYGLGYPFFNFYGSFAFYVAAGWNLLGLAPVESLKLTQGMGFLAASLTMYALARRHFGAVGGLVAAAAYGYAPYHLVNVFARGDSLGEFTAMALVPLVLLLVELVVAGSLSATVLLALTLAALVLSHTLSALLNAPAIVLWSVFMLAQATFQRRALPWKALRLLVIAAAIGAGLSAFFWIPALVDRQYVQMEFVTTGYFDFRNHFLTLSRLVQPWPVYDYGLSGTADGALPFQVGLGQAILTILGVLAIPMMLRRRKGFVVGGGALLVTVGYLWLATPLSVSVWSRVETLQIVQFPWRLLAPASVGMALLAGLPGLVLRGRGLAIWGVLACIVAILAGVLGANPSRWRIPAEDITAAAVQRYEYLTSSIGSTVRYEYLTNAARERPWTSSYVTEPDGVPIRPLPGQPIEVLCTDRLGMRDDLAVRLPNDARIIFERFYFPEVRVTVDGEPAAVEASNPEGYLIVSLPGGEHHVSIQQVETRIRRWSRYGSLAALVLLVGAALVIFVSGFRRFINPPVRLSRPGTYGLPAVQTAMQLRIPTLAAVILIGTFASILFLIRLPWSDLAVPLPTDKMNRHVAQVHAPWPYVAASGVPIGASTLTGYQQTTEVVAGQAYSTDLVIDGNSEGIAARIVAPAELIVGAPRTIASGSVVGVSPLIWPDGVTARAGLVVPLGTPPGLYQLELARADGVGERWLLDPFRVIAPTMTTAPSAPPIANFGGRIGLQSIRLADGANASMPSILLDWRSIDWALDDWRVSARFVDEPGRIWAASDGRPADGFAPTRLWHPGDIISERRDLRPIGGMPPGVYRLEIRVYNLDGHSLDVIDARGAAIAPVYRSDPFSLGIGNAPAPPAPDAPRAELIEGKVGIADAGVGTSIPIGLLWRIGEAPGRDLDIVVTIGSEELRIRAGGAFSASQWRPGEIVRDQVSFVVPPEMPGAEYDVAVRLEDPSTGGQLVTSTTIGRINVRNRPRQFDLPAIQTRVGGVFGDGIELVGFNLDRDRIRVGQSVGLTLVWTARRAIPTSFTVFTHILDGDRRVRGQIDSVPGKGALPTSGWAVGEVIADRYDIPLEPGAIPGNYQVEIGLYDATSGRRLTVTGSHLAAGDHVLISAITVDP